MDKNCVPKIWTAVLLFLLLVLVLTRRLSALMRAPSIFQPPLRRLTQLQGLLPLLIQAPATLAILVMRVWAVLRKTPPMRMICFVLCLVKSRHNGASHLLSTWMGDRERGQRPKKAARLP